jgi:thiol:disulfide interchange protein DsbC
MMNPLKRGKTFLTLVAFLLLGSIGGQALPAAKTPPCPSPEKVWQGLQKAFPKVPFEILKVEPSETDALCQVRVRNNGRIHLVYTDRSGNFLITGNLLEMKSGRNVTQENLMVLNRLGADDLKQLDSLTAFSLGRGRRTIYLVTDPQCPYCKQAENLLKKMVEKEDLTVRFILFPLESYKGSREQCISVICDQKGIEGFDSGYRSDNQCPEGIKKIESTASFLKTKGIQSTPTLIFFDGIYLIGAPSEETFQNRLKQATGGSKP